MSILTTIRRRLGDANTRVVRGLVLVFIFLILGKLASVAKEMAIAYRHGVSETVDIYVFTYVVVSWIPLVLHSIGQSVLVPTLKRLDFKSHQEFLPELFKVAILSGATTSIALYFFSDNLISLFASGFSPVAQGEAISFLRFISPSALLLLLVTVFSAELLSREKHANTLVEAIPALVVFLCVLGWPVSRPALEPFAIGTLLGLTIQLITLASISSTTWYGSRILSPLNHTAWRSVSEAMSILVLGAVFVSIAKPIDQILAARMGEGGVSQLSFAVRILTLGLGLGTTVLTRALLPVLSDNSHSIKTKLRITGQWTSLTIVAGSIGALIAWWWIPEIVVIVFERGAFTSLDSEIVSLVVRFGLVQVPFVMAGMVIIQYFASIGEYKTIAVSGIIGAVVKLISIFPLVAIFDLRGIMLSSGLMYFSTFVFLLLRFNKKVRIS